MLSPLAWRRGHPVHLVAHRAAAELTSLQNVTLHRVPKPFNSYLLGEPLLGWAGQRWGRRISLQGGRVLTNGGNCAFGDVNWVHFVHAADHSPTRAGLLRRCKGWWTRRGALVAERQALRKARLILANSERTRRDLIDLVGIDAGRIHTVYYGIDRDRFRPLSAEERQAARQRLGWPAQRPLAVFVGGLGDRRKGFDTLYTAWVELCRDPAWDADLVVIGRGAELPVWEARSREAGLEQRIRFLGFRADVPDILPACDVLIAPTRYEAYGLGVQEALCCGLPAFVSRSAGVAECYTAELAGLLLDDPEDAVVLAKRLVEWRSANEKYRLATLPLSDRLRSRSWDDMAAQILQLTQSVP